MPLLARLRSFLRNTLDKRRVEGDLNEELSSYLELLTAEKMKEGLNPEQARRAALIELGGVEQMKEEVRDVRIGAKLESVWKDLLYAVRILGKKPVFTAVAILTLAVGIGANTAIFSVVNAVLLQPLPYPNADRLAVVWSELGHEGRAPASGPELVSLQQRSRLFEEFAGIWVQNGELTGNGEPQQVKVGLVTYNFPSLLSSRPQLGRFFLPEEQGAGRNPVVILSDGLWRRRYGSDPQLIGRGILLSGRTCTVVGVMPDGFRIAFPDETRMSNVEVFVPFSNDLAKDERDQAYIRVLGRLRNGVTFPQAQAEADILAAQFRSEFTEYSEQSLGLQVVALQGDVVRNVRPALLALFGGVGLVLLIACANVANLLLSRANEREKEITVRTALGAPASRIIRQLLTESILLACLGGLAALVVGSAALKWFLAMRPEGILRTNSIELNLAVLGFTTVISVGAGILFGLAPAWQAAKVDLIETLKEGGRTITSDRRGFRNLLVICEVALGFVLLIGACLMIRTFQGLLRVDPGFDPNHVLTFQVSLPSVRYPKPELGVAFVRELQKRLSALPGVQSAGAVSHLPFDDNLGNWYSYYWAEGAPKQEQNTRMADHRSVLAGFFPSLGVTFVAGRNFDLSDEVANRKVVIIDDTLAEQVWPNGDAIGKRLNIENGQFVRDVAEVVGVVKHVQYHSLANQVRPQLYLPYPRAVRANMAFTVRTTNAPLSYVDLIRQEVWKMDKDLPVSNVRPMEEYIFKTRSQTRFVTMLSGALAGIALLLACIGIYGVTASSVLQRTNEIGIRMAMGAQRLTILKAVLRQSMVPTIWGTGIGFVLSLLLTPLFSNLLFGVRPTDPATFAITSVFLCAVGLLASYVPAHRATRTSPMAALRYE
jgi:predicted permease